MLRLLPGVDEGITVVAVAVEEGAINVEALADIIGRPVRRLLPLLAPTAGTGFTIGRLTDCLGGIPVARY